MSERMTFTLVLTGARTGKTVNLNKCQFVDGKYTLSGDAKNVGGLIRYMGRVYKAFPQGSAELARYQEIDRGQTYVDQGPGDGSAAAVPSDVHSDGAADEAPADGGTPAGGGLPGAEGDAEGNRLKRSRILEALKKLDHGNDEHWTQSGKPAVHVLGEMLKEPVSRSDINEVAPDFKREE